MALYTPVERDFLNLHLIEGPVWQLQFLSLFTRVENEIVCRVHLDDMYSILIAVAATLHNAPHLHVGIMPRDPRKPSAGIWGKITVDLIRGFIDQMERMRPLGINMEAIKITYLSDAGSATHCKIILMCNSVAFQPPVTPESKIIAIQIN